MSRFEKVDLKAMDNSVDCTKLTARTSAMFSAWNIGAGIGARR